MRIGHAILCMKNGPFNNDNMCLGLKEKEDPFNNDNICLGLKEKEDPFNNDNICVKD